MRNQHKRPIIQPCKGCISTAGGYHCHFPCSCYHKGDTIILGFDNLSTTEPVFNEGAERARIVAKERGRDWDTMTEDEREEFIDEIVHEK